MKLFRNKRNQETDALIVKMMEDGSHTNIMETKAISLIDDTILIKYMERNVENNIDSVKWYLNLLYPVSNKIVRYVLDNNILELIPNVYTSYCDNRLRKMKLSDNEYKQIIKKFKGYGSIPEAIIKGYIKQRYLMDDIHTLPYIQNKVALELLSDEDLCDISLNPLNNIMTLSEYHYIVYIKAKGSNIKVFNQLKLIGIDLLYQFCKYNEIIDLSLLDDDIISNLEIYRTDNRLRYIVEASLYSNIDNIEYIRDILPEDVSTILSSDKCNITNIDSIPHKLITEKILYNFFNNGGLISDTPKTKHNLLNLILYKTAIVGNTINIEDINKYDKDIIFSDISLIDKLFNMDEFMVESNRSLILSMYYTLCNTLYSIKIYEKYPLLFRIHISGTMSRSQVESILINNPRLIQYIPEYMITYRALTSCIMNGVTLNDVNHCKLNVSDLFNITRYNLQDLLLLDNTTFSRVIGSYWDSMKPRVYGV